jgi:tetratricopeptide (TPR) repeat protein
MPKTNAASPHAGPSRGRLWLFRLILIVGLPLATLALLEGALRLAGFGYPASFLLADTIAGRAVLRDNPDFTQRFFAPHLVRTPHSFAVDADKPAGTYRILVLGESAAMGDPAPAFGFSRLLSVMLAARYPDRRFEVVNAGVTTINSHAVREIARDGMRLRPDLVVVYMGNNEVVGPYGVGTVFNPFTGSLSIIRAQLLAKSLRLGQMFDRLGRWAGANKGVPERWEGMTMFLGHEVRATDPGLQHVYAHFQRNLEDILAASESGGAKVIVSTVGTNLKDSPPFGSQHRPGLSAENEKKWRATVDAGIAEEAAGHADAALRLYAEARAVDDSPAELAFRQARLLYAQERYEDAYAAFARARDLDTLRFRADSTINRLIRETAARHRNAGVGFVDIDGEFRKASPHGIPGDELLYEHVHMTFAGNYVIAHALAEAAAPFLGEARGPLPSVEETGQRLGLSEWHQARILNDVLERFLRPPFLGQIDADARKRRLQERLHTLSSHLTPAQLPAMVADLTARVAGAPDWEMHENLAQILEATGQAPAAIGEWRAVIERVPHYMEAHANLAKLLFRAGKGDAALAEFEIARGLRPYVSDSYNNIGAMYASQGKWAEAIHTYERALAIDPSSRDTLINLAMARAAQKNLDEARMLYQRAAERPAYTAESHYQLALCARALDLVGEAKDHCQAALAIEPRHAPAYRLLMEIFRATGQGPAALAYVESLLKSDPGHALAHETAGEILEAKGDPDEAAAHYEQAIVSDPQLDDAYLALATLRRKQGRLHDAATVLEKGAAARPGTPAIQQRLVDVYMELPDPARAVAACRRIRERTPQDWMATAKLAFILATAPDAHLRDGSEALNLAQEADRASGHRDPRVLNSLAAALAESKRFPEATVAAREAIQAAQVAGQADLAARIDKQAARYARGLTYETPAANR